MAIKLPLAINDDDFELSFEVLSFLAAVSVTIIQAFQTQIGVDNGDLTSLTYGGILFVGYSLVIFGILLFIKLLTQARKQKLEGRIKLLHYWMVTCAFFTLLMGGTFLLCSISSSIGGLLGFTGCILLFFLLMQVVEDKRKKALLAKVACDTTSLAVDNPA